MGSATDKHQAPTHRLKLYVRAVIESEPNLAKMISLVSMATNVLSKLLTIVFLFLSVTDHSVKVSSDSESVRAWALLEMFGGYREMMLNDK